MQWHKGLLAVFILYLFAMLGVEEASLAHCDTMDGPVVVAARKALDSGNPALVLIWVQAKGEPEIRKAFKQTLNVRKAGGEAKDLADRYFFETLVRIHRAGEGAPYTGLKSASEDLGPAIPAADRALEEGKVEPLAKLLTSSIHSGLNLHFKEALSAKKFSPDDVKAGRNFVQKYVTYMHYIERVYQATKASAHGHYPENSSAHFEHED